MASREQQLQEESQRRRHYRVSYPAAVQPMLITDDQQFQVVEVAERGIKFVIAATDRSKLGPVVHGRVRFRNGRVLPVNGAILRMESELAVLELDRSIPIKIIREEEIFLIRHYRNEKQAWEQSSRSGRDENSPS